jgi:hypothetical protein
MRICNLTLSPEVIGYQMAKNDIFFVVLMRSGGKPQLPHQPQTLLHRLQPLRGSWMCEAHRRRADGEPQALGDGPSLVGAVEVAGGEGIASTRSSGDETLGKIERGLVMDGAAFFDDDGSGFKVDDDLAFHPGGEQGLRGGLDEVEAGQGGFEIEARGAACFDFVEDKEIGVGQRGGGDLPKVRIGGTDEIHASEESGGLRGFKHTAGDGAAIIEQAVHLAEQHEVAEVEDFRLRAGEIEVALAEQRIGTELMEEGAAATAGGSHGIGVAGGGAVGLLELGDVDARCLAVAQNPAAIGIRADESGGGQGVTAMHGSEIFEHVVGTTTVGGGFTLNEGQHVLLWPRVDELDVVDDEIATGEDSCAGHE